MRLLRFVARMLTILAVITVLRPLYARLVTGYEIRDEYICEWTHGIRTVKTTVLQYEDVVQYTTHRTPLDAVFGTTTIRIVPDNTYQTEAWFTMTPTELAQFSDSV